MYNFSIYSAYMQFLLFIASILPLNFIYLLGIKIHATIHYFAFNFHLLFAIKIHANIHYFVVIHPMLLINIITLFRYILLFFVFNYYYLIIPLKKFFYATVLFPYYPKLCITGLLHSFRCSL